jgi:hypothetical protein
MKKIKKREKKENKREPATKTEETHGVEISSVSDS